MGRATYRVLKWIAAAGLVAAVLVLIYDVAVTIRWSGSRDVELTIEAPHAARSVSYVCWWNGEADHYRALIAQYGIGAVRAVESPPKSAERQPDGTFVVPVSTSGRESGLKLLSNTYHQQSDALIVVELENGEQWVSILKLPEVTKTTRAAIRIPDDAVRLPPVPAGNRGGN
jgi:hypothetical protein